jgi:hypothetical protein
MRGDVTEARRLIDEAIGAFEELGLPLLLAATLGLESAAAHQAEGDLGAAEADLRRAVDLLRAMDEKAVLSTVAARLAHNLCLQEKDEEEIEGFLELSEGAAATGDWVTHLMIKEVRASLLARQGAFEAAVSLAREALALAEGTDDLKAGPGNGYCSPRCLSSRTGARKPSLCFMRR